VLPEEPAVIIVRPALGDELDLHGPFACVEVKKPSLDFRKLSWMFAPSSVMFKMSLGRPLI
jgi:hypothetical protein